MDVRERLEQATCEVLDVDGVLGEPGRSLGTAWLVTDQGHLITAGHVVVDLYEAAVVDAAVGQDAEPVVHVRFPARSGRPGIEQAVFQMPPIRDRSADLDVAVLRLVAGTDRDALPTVLVDDAEGDVRVTGYGSNTPGRLQSGRGTLTGHSVKGAQSDQWLFQYETSSLTHTGFSGSAVWSTTHNAVIGFQVSYVAGRDRREPASALAMPLIRVVDYWADLRGFTAAARRRACVLIQPRERTPGLRDDVVRPVLDALGMDLYESHSGATNDEDYRRLELADAVVADVTGDDSNVVYELAVAQALGVPDVVVADAARSDGDHSMFQIQLLDLDEPEAARENLRERLEVVLSTFGSIGATDTGSNPLRSFFRTPLTQISAADALSRGYLTNFVRPVSEILRRVRRRPGEAEVVVDGKRLRRSQLADITLTVVLPDRLSWARDEFITRDIAAQVVDVSIDDNLSRPRTMKARRPRKNQPVVLYDVFPTTMNVMTDSIAERVAHLAGSPEDQRVAGEELERKEIDRFHLRLLDLVRNDPDVHAGERMRAVVHVARASAVFPDLYG
ncbi:STING domain-containing protein [Myceligenerans pegani]|uniref:Trypsin-like peptidase domain-containing protein n=1 Tax=Myceligenerans pegani TaxID=2776917 RepID=A0ABR9N365_9MICO|nr:STING domain-containing protein [Myceligenerans sp. TRM 65318]MBE1878103.1 trypsin-like peptidase domain-containing protein [Myceligenerans sp. TRM 65318]MBE3020374.1 trypsin-like peptidase domain-containing protein [Myceligenerans sp. TRM 65318]